jgi:hypothetical protein
MSPTTTPKPAEPAALARDYLAERLEGARDCYLVALALGERDNGSGGAGQFGRMIREARIHFAAVIEEARMARLDTSAIAGMLAERDVSDSIRPELKSRVEELFSRGGRRPG